MNEMTREQKQKLCDIYNGSDIEALDYMYEFLKDNHNPEMLELLDRVHTLNMETTLGWAEKIIHQKSQKNILMENGNYLIILGLKAIWVTHILIKNGG